MNFKLGEKVVCINPVDGLIKNEIYTIKFIYKNAFNFYEHNKTTPDEGIIVYYNWRFRKLDYDFVDSVCEMIEQDNLIIINNNAL